MIKKILLPILLLVSVISFGQVPNYAPSNGLVGWWGFNGNANDESVNTNNGTVNGATLTTDRFSNANSAYSLVSGNYILVDNSPELNSDYCSISIWFETTNTTASSLIYKTDASALNEQYSLALNFPSSENTRWSVKNGNNCATPGSGWQNINTNINVNDGVWHHIVCSYDGEVSSIFIDNVLVQSGVFAISILDPCGGEINIGKGYNTVFPFTGKLDDIGIWNRALTQCEISALYHAQQLTPPIVSLGSDTLSACGATTTLDAGSAPAWASYLWNTSETTQSISVSNSGLYTIAVTDTAGCVGYDTTLVSIIAPTIIASDTVICIGDSLELSVPSSSNCSGSNSLQFDGTDGYIGVNPLVRNANADLTINYWAKGQGAVTCTKTPQYESYFNYSNDVNGNRISYHLGILQTNSGNEWDVTAYGDLSTDYHFYSITVDDLGNGSTIAEVFLDGVSLGQHTYPYSIPSYSQMEIGRNIVEQNGLYDGNISHIHMWDGILTLSEIQQYMNCPPTGNEAGLVGYWNFEEGSGIITSDQTSNGNDGTLNGGVTWSTDVPQSVGNNNSILWSTGDTTSTITVQPTQTTTYSVTIDDGISSCTDDVTITVNDPQVNLGPDQTVCQGDSVLLDAGSGYNYYSWSTGETSQSIYASQGGNYDATVGDSVAVNNNYSLEFDGVDDYVETNNSPNWYGGNAFTWTLWVYLSDINSDQLFIKHGTANGASGDGAYFNYFAQRVIFTSPLNGGEGVMSPINVIPQNTWTHLSIVVDVNQETTLYVNGQDVSLTAYNGILTSIAPPSTSMVFGRDVLNNQQSLNGRLDDILIWNTPLAQSEIQQYMNCPPSGNETGLVGYWDFEEGSGTTTTDQTSNVNDGTLNGGVTWSTDVPNQTCVSCTATDDIVITELQPTVGSETVSECNSYLWSTDGQTYNQTGQYTAVLTNSQGCDSIVTLNLTINQPPTVDAGADQTICSGNPVTISGNGATSYTWDNGVSDGVAFSPLSTATYTVTGTDGNGCENSDQVLVTVNTLPAVSGGLDVSVCIGDSAVLNGSGAVSYSWDNGISDGVYFSPLFTNTYTVTGTDGNGCENSDQVDVTVNALPTVGAGVDQSVCEGDPVTVSGTGASSYTWDNGVSDGVAFNATTTTTYTVTGTDVNGCENTDNIVVTVTSSPNVVAVAAADSVCVNWENVTLSGSPAGGVFSGNGVTDNRFYPPVAGVGSHVVVYSYTDPTTGCVGTDSLTIVVEECTGITENGLSNLTIYPNPTSDQITIDIKGYNGVVNVELYDLQGRLLETTTNTTVSLKKHAKGIYVLKVSYGEITEEVRVVRD